MVVAKNAISLGVLILAIATVQHVFQARATRIRTGSLLNAHGGYRSEPSINDLLTESFTTKFDFGNLEGRDRSSRSSSTSRGVHGRGSRGYQNGTRSSLGSRNDDPVLRKLIFQAKNAISSACVCNGPGRDYILLIDESEGISDSHWNNEVYKFTVLLTYAIAAVKNESNLSIVEYSTSPRLVFKQRVVNRNSIDNILGEIDRIFRGRTRGLRNLGEALKFIRESVMKNGRQFIGTNVAKEISRNDAVGKNTVVILLIGGQIRDARLAIAESFLSRRNGVLFFVFGIDGVNSIECKRLCGCPRQKQCPYFMQSTWNDVASKVSTLVKHICEPYGLNAVCLEKWSEYSECSKTCGLGYKVSRLLGVTSLLAPTEGQFGRRGLSCIDQYQYVTSKKQPCNVQACTKSFDSVLDKLLPIGSVKTENTENRLEEGEKVSKQLNVDKAGGISTKSPDIERNNEVIAEEKGDVDKIELEEQSEEAIKEDNESNEPDEEKADAEGTNWEDEYETSNEEQPSEDSSEVAVDKLADETSEDATEKSSMDNEMDSNADQIPDQTHETAEGVQFGGETSTEYHKSAADDKKSKSRNDGVKSSNGSSRGVKEGSPQGYSALRDTYKRILIKLLVLVVITAIVMFCASVTFAKRNMNYFESKDDGEFLNVEGGSTE